MADRDDERPDFDSAFSDEPAERPARRRRISRRGKRRRSAPDDTAQTGESPVPGGGGGEDEEPAPRTGGRRRRGRPGRPRRRARSPRGRGGGGGGAAVLQRSGPRLALGVAFAAILILVITLVVRDCQRSQLEDSYTEYMDSVAQLVSSSAEQGQELRRILDNNAGSTPPELRQSIREVANQAGALVGQANDLDPPGSLSSEQRSFVTALEYRVSGLNTLADQLPSLLQSQEEDFTANGIANVMQRFLTSDVLYADSFAAPARRALEEDDIGGVEVPPEQPFLTNPALAAPGGARNLIPNLQRRSPQGDGQDGGGGGDGNLRGTSLARTEALPSETVLTPGETVSVQASEQLKWRVTVENGGDFDETGIIVKATFRYPNSGDEAETREASIESLPSGETTTVELAGPSAPVFGEVGSLVVEIEPVPGETNADNNSGEYPVRIVI